MKKICLLLLYVVLYNYITINAQTQIETFSLSFKNVDDVEVKIGNTQWTNKQLLEKLMGSDSIHVKKGEIDLIRVSDSKSKTIPPIMKTSIIKAWKDEYVLSRKHSASLGKELNLGGETEDTLNLQFAFMNILGDSIINVQRGETLKGITIKQSSYNTLYAYIYWVFPRDSDYIKMSNYLIDSVCILKPLADNEFVLKEPMAITRDKDSIDGSIVYIGISKEKKEEPILYNVTTLDELKSELKKNGLFIYSIEIKYNTQQ